MTYLTSPVVDVDATLLCDGNLQRTSEPGIYSLDFVDMFGVKWFIDSLSGPRRAILETRGLLCIKVTAPPTPRGSSFNWIRSPTDDFPDDAEWYIDGSLIDGSWAFSKRIGSAS